MTSEIGIEIEKGQEERNEEEISIKSITGENTRKG
jgi:hypothetical protein